ncbi:MAG TPA: hypothetical protein DCW90_09745 [Lachnospiraceae bacterium]|nr:hypothetical protein [Lachnospiraceae bacterium]
MIRTVYEDKNSIHIVQDDYICSFMNNAKVRKYKIVFYHPVFDFSPIDDDIVLCSCCGIPIQEYKCIGTNYLSSSGMERWKTWGPHEYGINLEDYLKFKRYVEWFPQAGYNAHDVYDKEFPSKSYSLSSIKDEVQLYDWFCQLDEYYVDFYDYNYTSERYINGFPSTPILVHFMKKYNILEMIEDMIGGKDNLIDK